MQIQIQIQGLLVCGTSFPLLHFVSYNMPSNSMETTPNTITFMFLYRNTIDHERHGFLLPYVLSACSHNTCCLLSTETTESTIMSILRNWTRSKFGLSSFSIKWTDFFQFGNFRLFSGNTFGCLDFGAAIKRYDSDQKPILAAMYIQLSLMLALVRNIDARFSERSTRLP